jgi:hypothetical protein
MSRRWKTLIVGEHFPAVFLGRDAHYSYELVRDGLPPDARIVDACMVGRRVHFTVESLEFERTAGPPWPELEPLLRRVGRPELVTAEASVN